MTDYEKMKKILEQYLDKHGVDNHIESSLHDTSVNKADKNNLSYLYQGEKADLKVLDMDEIAHNAYRLIKYPNSNSEEDAIASADAFVINGLQDWYFIEFKDQKINNTKDSVTKKAYQNWYWFLDILYEMKDKVDGGLFDFDNPIKFAKEHVFFILVISEEKNMSSYRKMHECRLAGEKFTVPFMEKLEKYIFKETFIYTPENFEREFVNKFMYC